MAYTKPELPKPDGVVIFDLEGDGFLDTITTVHCVAALGQKFSPKKEQIAVAEHEEKEVLGLVKSFSNTKWLIAGHNIAGFDIPVIKKMFGIDLMKDKQFLVFDTLLASQLLYPDNPHGHSLEEWASRLKQAPKVNITDWSKYTPEMLERCKHDVLINTALFDKLYEEMMDWGKDIAARVMWLEARVAYYHQKQVQYGVRFDVLAAAELMKELDTKIDTLKKEITGDIPPRIVPEGATVQKPFKKDGNLTKTTKVWYLNDMLTRKKLGVPGARLIRGPFSKISYEQFNLDSPKQVTEYLLALGWVPTQWNFRKTKEGDKIKTSPKLTEDSYSSLPQGLGRAIGDYNTLVHRRRWLLSEGPKGKVKGALSTVNSKGRVPAQAFTCATPTSRYRHYDTICNIPRPSTLYGDRIRSLFVVPKGSYLMGLDLKGIEARMLAHYCYVFKGGDELAERIISKDFHLYNSTVWKVDRDSAKSGLYALIYGCGEAKLASTLGKRRGAGKRLFKAFWDANEPIKLLLDSLFNMYDSGVPIRGLDGRVLKIRQRRMILNTMLQSAAAIVFKLWMVKINEWIELANCEEFIHQIIAMHDELQFEMNKELIEERGTKTQQEFFSNFDAFVKECLKDVEKELGIMVPLEVDIKIGQNWADTH